MSVPRFRSWVSSSCLVKLTDFWLFFSWPWISLPSIQCLQNRDSHFAGFKSYKQKHRYSFNIPLSSKLCPPILQMSEPNSSKITRHYLCCSRETQYISFIGSWSLLSHANNFCLYMVYLQVSLQSFCFLVWIKDLQHLCFFQKKNRKSHWNFPKQIEER